MLQNTDRKPADIIRQFTTLKSERSVRDANLQEITYPCMPTKAYITNDRVVKGERAPVDIYDSTAIDSAIILAAALHGYLTNPSSRWFALKMEDPKLNDDGEVKDWLKIAQDAIYETLNGSNFNQQIHEMYLDLVVFGTGVMFEEEDLEKIIRFSARPINEIFIMEDENERVKHILRKFRFTAMQAYGKWKEKAGESVLKAMTKNEYTKEFEFIHYVCPRNVYDPDKSDNLNMPFASYYVSIADKVFVDEGGYQEFPCFVPRYSKVSDDPYGYSPAWIALPDIKMANKQTYILIRAGEKAVDPPLVLPHDGFILPIKLNAAALNYRLPGTLATDKIEPLISGQNIPVGLELLQHVQNKIQTKFHTDLFLMLMDSGKMTAQEVLQRVSDRMIILGPVIGRLMTELLEPIIERTFNILLRNGKIPLPPNGLNNTKYAIDYLGPLAKAQRNTDVQAITNLLAIVQSIITVRADAGDKVNTDKAIDRIADVLGTPPDIIVDDKEVMKIRQIRLETQAQERQIAMLQAGANIAKTGADAHKSMQPAK